MFVPTLMAASRRVLVTGLLATLAACGGGGGGGSFDGQTPPSTPPGPSTPVPQYAIGTGIGASFQNGVLTASQTTLSAGETATIRANAVITNSNNDPIGEPEDLAVRFRSICAASGRAEFGEIVFNNSGLITVPYTNRGCEGEDTVTVTLLNGTTVVGTATVNLAMITADVLTVTFVSATHDQLSLAGIGGNESSELTFLVAGPQGVPIAGKQVRFSINTPVGGASILPGRETGVTDQNGQVRTVLNSGTVAGPVNVLAVHQETGKQGISADITISTGVPVADRFSLSYGPFNPLGAWNTDGIEVNLSIIASDAFGNNPTDGTRVSFVAPEGGNVQSSCLLENGSCSVVWRSTSPRPNDRRVEVIAYTDGAEAFTDRNGDFVYDAGDGPIRDQGEPYADENENGSYDIGEFFFDTNRNGVRDPGNGRWDGPCLDKINSAAICTGNGTVTIYDTATIVLSTDFARLRNPGDFPPPGTPINIQQGSSVSLFGLEVADSTTAADPLGGNPLPVGTSISFSVEGAGVQTQGLTSYVVPSTTVPTRNVGIVLTAAAVGAGGELPVNTRLLLTIQVPSRQQQQFSWPIVVGP